MGPILPKPVTTKVLERKRTELFHVGIGYMNGFREKMEDAHAVHTKADWGFFGVFDGHCGPLCSVYVADKFPPLIEAQQVPIPDKTLSEISLAIDRDFLSTRQEGGSTGTWMIAQLIGDTYKMQVGNVGDSRVVLGRRKTKEMVSMTNDHKPILDEESARIRAAGGHVSNNRVDGSLAVSRAFGDASYKGGDQYKSKVIAVPEIMHFEAKVGDIVLLCCDGVFESDAFSNESVMQFIFERLEQKMDLACIAAAVCDEAMLRGSKDNISAMLVQLGGEVDCLETPNLKENEVVAGPFNANNEKFQSAYIAMAESAGLTGPQCCELRFDQVRDRLAQRKAATGCTDFTCDFTKLDHADLLRLVERFKDHAPVQGTREDYIHLLQDLQKEAAEYALVNACLLKPLHILARPNAV
eukprot:TRINITY_DN4384_c0_g1_i2.p1 TRINITY_DN4384_c0_g1~~TRINITY_DN4384_c0_g1_i2.p1  ORF type:complete len:411 (+),score=107.61 TRINITY_DN4384_c0_g1_i2:879-2111(+)